MIGVGINRDDGSPQRQRLVAAFDRFIDGHGQTPLAIAQQLRALEVDILVDLNGTPGTTISMSSATGPHDRAGKLAGLCRHDRGTRLSIP